jgi:aromatic-amino-acid transaminase
MEFLIGSRRERPGDDPIFSLNAEAKQRAADGESVVNATIGALLDDDGSLSIMPSVAEAIRSLPPAVTAAYAPIPGRPDFRQAVIDDLFAHLGLVDQAVGVATPGGSGALRMSIDNFLEPHQTVLTSSYYWAPYRTLADEAGRGFATFNMFAEDGRLDAPDFERKLSALLDAQGRALVLLNTPCHNPTGYSLDGSELDDFCAALGRHAHKGPVTVVLDIAYGYYAPDALNRAVTKLTALADRVLTLFAWSASKSFLQYGARVGALVALVPDEAERTRIKNALTYSCRGLWSNCNAGGMAAITRVLVEPELRARAKQERGELSQMLSRRVGRWNELAGAAGIDYPRYDGGFFTTVFCDDPQRVAASLREEGIFVVPTAGAVRIAICSVNEAQIEQIVDGLTRAL